MDLPLRYWKLNAAGNDFVLVEAARVLDGPGLARHVCPRRTSVGADGLLVVDDGPRPRVVHYDPDGSRSFCLNGLRAVACWLWSRGRSARGLTLETDAGPRPVIGDAVWAPPGEQLEAVEVDGTQGTFVDVGNPQLVVELSNLEAPGLMELGKTLRWHPRFPEGTNVTFVAQQAGEYRVRTYERGVEGETLACGTGVVAAACALVSGTKARFVTRGGDRISVTLEREHGVLQGVWSRGPASLVSWGRVPAPAAVAIRRAA